MVVWNPWTPQDNACRKQNPEFTQGHTGRKVTKLSEHTEDCVSAQYKENKINTELWGCCLTVRIHSLSFTEPTCPTHLSLRLPVIYCQTGWSNNIRDKKTRCPQIDRRRCRAVGRKFTSLQKHTQSICTIQKQSNLGHNLESQFRMEGVDGVTAAVTEVTVNNTVIRLLSV